MKTKFKHDKTKDNWEVLEDVSKTLTKKTTLEEVYFLEGSEDYIAGTELAKRAVKLQANLGQHDAEFLLENQELIPKEFQEHYLIFPGTKWRAADGDVSVPYLRWGGDRWSLHFAWLVNGFDSGARLVRPRKSGTQ